MKVGQTITKAKTHKLAGNRRVVTVDCIIYWTSVIIFRYESVR